mmetsp:Transcript_18723/g.33490  ORF Transcript_18723/g.33490 Transcript_18723/m.33490 type:complete len:768 (-) Transcript_18723:189-2492(-)
MQTHKKKNDKYSPESRKTQSSLHTSLPALDIDPTSPPLRRVNGRKSSNMTSSMPTFTTASMPNHLISMPMARIEDEDAVDLREQEADEESSSSCCFAFFGCSKKDKQDPIRSPINNRRLQKGYTGRQPNRQHRLPEDMKKVTLQRELSITKTGPYQGARKESNDERGFCINVWSAVMGNLQIQDVQRMKAAQLHFFLPVLLQYGHLHSILMDRCSTNKSFCAEMYFWMRSNPDSVAEEYTTDVLLKDYLEEELGYSAHFYEHDVLEPILTGQLQPGQHVTPAQDLHATLPILTMETKETVLDKVVFIKKFASGHAPALCQGFYSLEAAGGPFSPKSKHAKFNYITHSTKKRIPKQKKLSRSKSAKFNNKDLKTTSISFRRSRSKLKLGSEHGSELNVLAPKPTKSKTFLIKPDSVGRAAGVVRMMELFNFYWKHSWLNGKDIPQALSYMVVPGGHSWGFIECIPDAVSVKDFNWKLIEKVAKKEEKDESENIKLNVFLRSTVGGLVAGHVLGLRDRHSDNILISQGYKFYHIDFKHCFNLQTKVLDAPSMVIPKGLYKLLNNLNKWDTFVDHCVEAFVVLRRQCEHLIRLSTLMFAGQVDPHIIEKSYIRSFFIGITEEKAKMAFRNHVASLPSSISSRIKEYIHANSPNVRTTKGKHSNSFRENSLLLATANDSRRTSPSPRVPGSGAGGSPEPKRRATLRSPTDSPRLSNKNFRLKGAANQTQSSLTRPNRIKNKLIRLDRAVSDGDTEFLQRSGNYSKSIGLTF